MSSVFQLLPKPCMNQVVTLTSHWNHRKFRSKANSLICKQQYDAARKRLTEHQSHDPEMLVSKCRQYRLLEKHYAFREKQLVLWCVVSFWILSYVNVCIWLVHVQNTCCVTLLKDIKKVFPGYQGMALTVDCYFFPIVMVDSYLEDIFSLSLTQYQVLCF